MDSRLFEELLHDSEGSSLDFKRDQYPFDGATDEQKSELLKDILAFANAWRRTEAYILIGVDDVQGGRSRPVGISAHIDDAKLQQFVYSKTNRPVTFSYLACQFDGVQIGVIRIEKQERPFFLTRNFGSLRKGIVYVRRGSSTKEADANDIYQMGRGDESSEAKQPVLKLEFADLAAMRPIDTELVIDLQPLQPFDSALVPTNRRSGISFDSFSGDLNQRYYHDVNWYLAFRSILRPLGFVVTNLSNFVALDVRMKISIQRQDGGLIFLSKSKFPKIPNKSQFLRSLDGPDIEFRHPDSPTGIDVVDFNDRYLLEVEFRKIQPKATVFSSGVTYVGSTSSGKWEIAADVYADNLQNPLRVPLSITINAKEERQITHQMLLEFSSK